MSAANILVVDDESDIRGLLQDILSDEGYRVTVAADARQARQAASAEGPDLVLLDIWMPDTDGITLLQEWSESGALNCPVVMMSGHGTVDTAVEATRLGAFDFVEKPLSMAKLLRTVDRALASGRRKRNKPSHQLLQGMVIPIGRSKAMQDLREQVKRIAPHDTNVLITGEAGTGREAFARYLHSLGPRSDQPFVVLVAASVTDDNAEALLFGTQSDSDAEPGVLAAASGGMLFINEIADLSATAQRLLLSALEIGAYIPRGATRKVPLNAQIVSSARPGVETLDDDVVFRRDLLAHLNVVPLRVPPLREYSEDVPELLRFYVEKMVDSERLPLRSFSVAAQNRLRNYPWPGNMHDLKNLVHRLLIMGGPEQIGLEEVEKALATDSAANEPLVKQDLLAMPLREAREHFEKAYLQQQLILCGGKVGKLAQRVGMERTHLYRKLRSLGVDFRQGGSDD